MLETVRVLLQPPLVYAVAGGWVVLFVALLVLGRYMNRRYVILRRSESVDQIAFELGRIAGALESIATSQSRPRVRSVMPAAPPVLQKRPRIDYGGEVGLSMFGR